MIPVDLCSETGRLNAVLMHRPGPEIEAMTPTNAHHALYSDILNLDIVNKEYGYFSGALSKVTNVLYVMDLLEEVLKDAKVCETLVRQSCKLDGCECVVDELLTHDPTTLSKELIEGFAYRKGKDPVQFEESRYLLKPLYNLFFTRDASSCMYDGALINSMSFGVRSRESYIYKAIFENCFKVNTLWAQQAVPEARTEGGDVHIVRPDLLCIGTGIRTNFAGIEYLAANAGKGKERFYVIAQELPKEPDSFIHLDMVFTFLGTHHCMCYEPMIRHTGVFTGMKTYLYTIEGGKFARKEYDNILVALKAVGMEMDPIFCAGGMNSGDFADWWQDRDQWHSGANFFSFGENHIIGYRRNRRTIEALNKAGFEVLDAEDVCADKVKPWDYEKAVITFAGSELPRGGGGARCMTCPINRDKIDW